MTPRLGITPKGGTPASGWSYRVLLEFDKAGCPKCYYGGLHPAAPLIDVNGTLYGTTVYGGRSENGTVYSITASGAHKVLHEFGYGSDGAHPYSGLTEVNGTLYGTTSGGGTSGVGTVFSISTSGSEKVLYSFKDPPDGGFPYSGLIDVNGKLYGTTEDGGDFNCDQNRAGCGTVYSISTSGSEHVLHRFGTVPDGMFPQAGLVKVNGVLYGTTEAGGTTEPSCNSVGCGTVYRITTSGKETVVYRFTGSTDGSQPSGGLIDVKGVMYGATSLGGGAGCGSPGCGVVYSVTSAGYEKVLHRFTGGANDGASPLGDLLDSKGTLYGTTGGGGSSCGSGCGPGTIYSVTTSGVERVLYTFTADEGENPRAGLVAVNGVLYGTTYLGGAHLRNVGGRGTVFAFSK